MNIPLTKPYWGRREERAAVRALRQTCGSGDGPYTKKCTELLKKITGAKYALLVTSCTHGMELAIAALVHAGRLKAKDEVIMPSFTMTSTANAVVLAGAQPVFADIEPEYYCIDPSEIKKKITSRTRGIMVVHYAGMACQMEKIRAIAQRHGLWIIEDAAHGVGASYKSKPLGRWSDIGVFSFHGTKNISCGEGGAVLTDNKDLADFMEIYRVNGTNRKAFLEGVVDKYSWVDKGTSYLPSDILVSILYEQLKQINTINIKRSHISSLYIHSLSKYTKSIHFPKVPVGTTPNWHIYAIRFYQVRHRDVFIKTMRDAGIEVSPHYVPLHSAAMGQRIAKDKHCTLPVTDMVSNTLVRLPIYPGLTKHQISYIITSARRVLDTLI